MAHSKVKNANISYSSAASGAKEKKKHRLNNAFVLLLITVFQLISAAQTIFDSDGEIRQDIVFVFGAYIVIEWMWLIISRAAFKRKNFELELMGFFLTGIGLTVVASVFPGDLIKQFVAFLLGLTVFELILWFVADIKRIEWSSVPLAIASVALLALNLILAEATNGALNWITVFGISFQPSEFVKIAFIFVGASTLEKLQSTRSLLKYIVFSVVCIGCLFLMYDFGAALIFFFTFILISFMRSGDIRTIAVVCGAALLGAILILIFKPYVAERFATYRHIWEYPDAGGYQQTRVLIYAASGGLFGTGIGRGELRNIFASTTDLVFGVLCEEWGVILAITVVLAYGFIAVHAIRTSQGARSSFFAIAATAAAGMMLFQTCLNVFGITDILPLTGVTLPFISQGGSSMICSWALLALIKACDLRTYPSFYEKVEAQR